MASKEGIEAGGDRVARAQKGREGAATATASERIREAREDRKWFGWGQLDGSLGVHEAPGPRDGAQALSEYNIGHGLGERARTQSDQLVPGSSAGTCTTCGRVSPKRYGGEGRYLPECLECWTRI